MIGQPTTRALVPTLRAVILALTVVGTASVGVMPARAADAGPFNAMQWLSLGQILTALLPGASDLLGSVTGESDAITYGGDGRLTVLLLGSDYRPTLSGDRTDAVLVLTINPKSKQVAALSIPRDIARLPLPNGTVYKSRVNTLYSHYKKGRTRAQAMVEVEKVIEHVLRIEIDYHAYIRFNGFTSLVDHVAGVSVKIPTAIKDPYFWDDPNKPKGIYFPASSSYLVKGSATLCNGLYKTQTYSGQPGYKCERALVYARTRKGTGNSDFKRARRHQDLTFAAVHKVRQRGKGALSELVNAVVARQSAGEFYTNIPLNLAHAEVLFDLASGAYMDRQVVLKPTTYASRIDGTATYKLKLSAVRTLTSSWFGPVP